jgi:hypothetical protein
VAKQKAGASAMTPGIQAPSPCQDEFSPSVAHVDDGAVPLLATLLASSPFGSPAGVNVTSARSLPVVLHRPEHQRSRGEDLVDGRRALILLFGDGIRE